MNTHWFKVFLVSLLLTICIVGGIFLTMQKTKNKNTALELQNFETKILDEHKQKLTEQGYEEVSLGVEPTEEKNKEIYFHYGFTEFIKETHETYPNGEEVTVDYYKKRL